MLSACDDEEQEGTDCLFGDDDFEKFKALPFIPMEMGATQVFEEIQSLQPTVAFEQPKIPTSFKISPDHPQIKVYRGYLKMLMGKGDI